MIRFLDFDRAIRTAIAVASPPFLANMVQLDQPTVSTNASASSTIFTVGPAAARQARGVGSTHHACGKRMGKCDISILYTLVDRQRIYTVQQYRSIAVSPSTSTACDASRFG